MLLRRTVGAHTRIVTEFRAGHLGGAVESQRTITALPMCHAAAPTTMELTMPRFGGRCARHVEFVTGLPKTPVGKVLRRAMREQWHVQGRRSRIDVPQDPDGAGSGESRDN